jgi:hypothetical protein
MKRDELHIRELEKEIVETSSCIHLLQSNISRLPADDPERIGAHKLMWRLMEARTDAWRTLSDLVEGVELRPLQH